MLKVSEKMEASKERMVKTAVVKETEKMEKGTGRDRRDKQ